LRPEKFEGSESRGELRDRRRVDRLVRAVAQPRGEFALRVENDDGHRIARQPCASQGRIDLGWQRLRGCGHDGGREQAGRKRTWKMHRAIIRRLDNGASPKASS